LDHLISPLVLYACLVMGAVGVCIALPRRGLNPQVIGGLVAAGGGGLVILLLTIRALRAGEGPPNIYFYIFSIIALGASLRVITHPKPVYAALYFILTIIASAGMYLLLSAEFMAFALVIVYAGAILITYLFVIMLATQAPDEEELERLAEYDRVSREPIAATLAGFAMLAALTTVLFGGTSSLPAPSAEALEDPNAVLAVLPGKVDRVLREARVPEDWPGALEGGRLIAPEENVASYDTKSRTAVVIDSETKEHREISWPAGTLVAGNVDDVAYTLLVRHPGSIEIAGIILLMAMLGAVVLARKKVEIEEREKARQAGLLGEGSA